MTDLDLVLRNVPSSDGRCTGFPNGIFSWDWTTCCVLHDAGGSDGALLDCLMGSVPTWAWPLAAFAVAVMVLYRPVYSQMQSWGWVK